MTSVFFWQNSVDLCSASFCPPRPNLPVGGMHSANRLEGEGPWEDGEGPEVPRHYVLIAEEHFLPLAMLGTKI